MLLTICICVQGAEGIVEPDKPIREAKRTASRAAFDIAGGCGGVGSFRA